MDTEAEATPAPDDNAQVIEPVTEAEEDVTLEEENDGSETDSPEFIEIERGGKTFTVPKELEGELLMQQDYTKKTMALAEERKAAQAEAEAIKSELTKRQADFDTYVEVKNLEARKAQLEAIPKDDLLRLREEDPVTFDQLDREYDRIERALAAKNEHLSRRTQEIAQAQEREIATRRERTIAEASAKIPNFTDERRAALEKLAVEQGGYTADQIKLASAGDYVLLDLAAEGLRARQARKAAAKQQAAAAPAPAAEIRGRAAPVKATDDRANIDSWMKARNEQLRGK